MTASCAPQSWFALSGTHEPWLALGRARRGLEERTTGSGISNHARRIATSSSPVSLPAKIALISLPPWGEDLDSVDPYQSELNRRVAEHNAVLQQLARDFAVTYIPFYELLRTAPVKPFTAFRILPFYRDLFRQLVLRQSNDEIAALNGWKYHRDGIHLNSVSGKLLADLVQQFLVR